MEDLNLVMRERLQKAQELERAEIALFPNSYAVPHQIGNIIREYSDKNAEELEQNPAAFVIAGRILAIRTFGKSIFMHLLDTGGSSRSMSNKTRWVAMRMRWSRSLISATSFGSAGPCFAPAPRN